MRTGLSGGLLLYRKWDVLEGWCRGSHNKGIKEAKNGNNPVRLVDLTPVRNNTFKFRRNRGEGQMSCESPGVTQACSVAWVLTTINKKGGGGGQEVKSLPKPVWGVRRKRISRKQKFLLATIGRRGSALGERHQLEAHGVTCAA